MDIVKNSHSDFLLPCSLFEFEYANARRKTPPPPKLRINKFYRLGKQENVLRFKTRK
jgi:hypothetical protein